jgi:hypothetical protein
VNQFIYDFAVWLDSTAWSTRLHESYYMYNWIETTHVLTLMISLGLLFVIDLRMLGLVLPQVPATVIARRLQWPMLFGFTIMIMTGLLLVYAIPVRSVQSLWLRIKVVLLIAAFINALIFHLQMKKADSLWEVESRAPLPLRIGAILSLAVWSLVVICGRFIAYDWFDCIDGPSPLIATLSGCVVDQVQY